MRDNITIESDIFDHREVKAHFIKSCCFGEDLATWLRTQVTSLTKTGFEISEPIQEDYGWGLWITHGKDPFWVALSYCGEGQTEEPAQWVVSVDYDPGFNILQRLFHRPDQNAFTKIRDSIWQALRSNDGIRIVDDTK